MLSHHGPPMTPPFHPSPQARGWILDGSKGCDAFTLVLDPGAGGKKRGRVGRKALPPIFPLCTLAREREKCLGRAEGDPGGGQSFGAQTLVLLVTCVSGMKLPPGCPRLLGHRPHNNCPFQRGRPGALRLQCGLLGESNQTCRGCKVTRRQRPGFRCCPGATWRTRPSHDPRPAGAGSAVATQ